MADPEGFGTSGTVQALGAASQQLAGDLDRLRATVDSDVMDTVPDRWGGEAASALQRHWYRIARWMAGIGSPLETYAKWLEVAAQTMARARQELQAAQRFADANGLYIRPDLTVAAYVPDRPDAAGLIGIAQFKVDGAKRLAELSRQQVRTANEMLEKHAAESEQEMQQIIDGMAGGRGGRRGGQRLGIRPRPPGRRRDEVDDDLTWGPEGRIRRPRADAGTWTQGTPGNGVWTPHRPGDFGLLPGQSIRWVDGVPDLAPFSPSPLRMPGGIDPDLRGLRLTRDHAVDARMGDQALADRIGMGWTADRVRAWRLENDFLYHHYSRDELQLVPGRIHRPLAHQGSASE